MPPKAKFTKDQIMDAAFQIVKTGGAEALTARSLGEKLGSSARPVFTVFKSMDEVQSEVAAMAYKLYEKYENDSMNDFKSFKGAGMGYIRFASEQPKIFQLLFMQERNSIPNYETVLSSIDHYYEEKLLTVQTEYGFCRRTSQEIYMHLWIYSHGIATLIATNVCQFSEQEISDMLTDVCSSIIKKYKAEGRE